MRRRGVDFDALKAVRRDLQQVIPGKALSVIEVRGDPEPAFTHKPNSVCYSRAFLKRSLAALVIYSSMNRMLRREMICSRNRWRSAGDALVGSPSSLAVMMPIAGERASSAWRCCSVRNS